MSVYLYAAYLVGMNLAAFLLMFSDKRRAVRGKWRIPEHTLFLTAALGGSAGGLLGMYLCRHKTRKWKFVLGFPLLLVLHILLTAFLLSKGVLHP